MALFGASGDLAGRHLLPALAALAEEGDLPPRFEMLGLAPEDWDDDAFREFAAERLDRFAGKLAPSARDRVLDALRFRPLDLADAGSARAALGAAASGEPVAAYLALPPATFADAIAVWADAKLPEGSRIAVEKPFGENLDGARRLNSLLRRAAGQAGEQAIFRVDHVLGMETTHNLIRLRSGGGTLAALWNGSHIEQVELLWEETLALEGRAGYYDRAGALKDVLQNHLMQLLCLVAMQPARATTGAGRLSDAKVDVLRAIDPGADDILRRSRRARYEAGRIGDREVPAYAAENGVVSDRETETFAEITVDVDKARWHGTEFVLRGAKALAERRKGVLARFRGGDELWIDIDGPDGVSMSLGGTVLRGRPPGQGLPAYAHVLTDLLRGTSAFSVRGDEAEESWRIVEPVLAGWAAGEMPLLSYPAGSSGP